MIIRYLNFCRNPRILVWLGLILLMALANTADAGGISIDAGLTPPKGRWIIRSQIRYMHRGDASAANMPEMKMYMFPQVLAYGLRPDVTIMLRQMIVRKSMVMSDMSNSMHGFGDLFALVKYKLLRHNTRDYIVGISPMLGLNLPTGADRMSSNFWDLKAGIFISGRQNDWAADLDISYGWMGLASQGDSRRDPGDNFAVELALARQFGFGNEAMLALAPVLEMSYSRTDSDDEDGQEVANTGSRLFYLSPGFKLTRSSLIFEFLIQFPVSQQLTGTQPDYNPGLLLGLRYML
jgi:hypothetical protein